MARQSDGAVGPLAPPIRNTVESPRDAESDMVTNTGRLMATANPSSVSTGTTAGTTAGRRGVADPNQYSAARVAGIYLIAGLFWIGLSDLTLVWSGELTAIGFLVSSSKGAGFVLVSAGLVFWLCRREYRSTTRAAGLLRAVVDGTTDAVFVKDREGRYLLINPAGAQFIGREVSELIGNDDRELFAPAEAERLMMYDQAIMNGGEVSTREETLTSDGITRTYQATKAPFFDATGKVAGLIGISRNITDRAVVESALRETDARLREAQRIAKLGSWSWEPSTDRVWWSDAEFELFGVDRRVVTPSFEAFLGVLHADDRAIAIARVEAMQAGGNEFADDLRVIRPNGECIWIHSRGRATRDTTGAIVRVEGIDQDITIQQRAEEALRESEMRLQAAVEIAELGVIAIDFEMDSVKLSQHAAKQFGLQAETSISRSSLHARFHSEDLENILQQIEVAMDPAGTGLVSLEHRVVRPDGTIRWLNARKQVTFAGGRPHRAVVVTADVTERRLGEARLREQEMLLREAAELAQVGGWGFDPVTLVSDWTPQVSEIYAVNFDTPPSPSETTSFFSPEQRPALEAAMAAASQEGIPYDMELQLTAANGEKKWVRTICRPITDGNRVVRVRGSLQDITDRKRAEAELRASEERYRLLFESNPHPMWVFDEDTLRYLAVNNAAVESYGYTREEFLGMTILDIRPPEDVAKLKTAIAQDVRGRQRAGQWKHRRKNGSIFDVEVSSHSLPEEHGRTRLVLALDITERIINTEALRSSEERLSEAARVAGFGVFEHDHVRGTFFWSPRLREIYGIKHDVSANLSSYLHLIHPDDRTAVEAAVRRAHEPTGDGRFDLEHRLIRPSDRQVRWLATHSQTQFAGEGTARHPVRTVGATIDVTDARVAAEALRLSEARYRQLVDMLPTAIFVHADNTILFGNPAFLRLVGASNPEEVLGLSPFDIAQPAPHEDSRQRQLEVARTGRALPSAEMRAIRRDGKTVPVYVVAAPIDGYSRPATLVAFSDLTERERATALLRSVLDSVGDAILTINAMGIVTSANRATERLFGYVESNLIGGHISVLMPEHSREYNQFFEYFLKTGVSHGIGIGREVECCRKDGTTFPAELTVSEFSIDGERNFTGVVRDLTDRRLLEEQFRQAQKMEAVGRLAGGIAHDFNNLLTVINGYTDLLLAGLSTDAPMHRPLVAVLDAGERAARLTQQLLAFSRKSVVEPRLVDLNELVTESASLLRRLIGEDVELSVITSPTPARVILDPGQLEQVLLNLAVNARDAMPTGGRLTIESTAVEIDSNMLRSTPNLLAGKYASLRVTDTGCGIGTEVVDKIFEPFFTTKGLGKGTGLGLAVVHGVVQQSGGTVTVESAVGAGTTFTVFLPAATDTESGIAPEVTRVGPHGNETVLVVEDEDAVRTLVQVALEGKGYTVLTASDGKEALSRLNEFTNTIDLLVTDVIMPGLSGRELAEAARSMRPGLRVLYMSGYTDDALDRHGMQGTDNQFIQKPFTPLSLARRVREIFDIR